MFRENYFWKITNFHFSDETRSYFIDKVGGSDYN